MAEINWFMVLSLLAMTLCNIYIVFSNYRCLKSLKRYGFELPPAAAFDDNVTRDEVRAELLRDRVVVDIVASDDTPEEVVRYLYIEAEQRARQRKRGQLKGDDNDLFAIPPFNPKPT